MLNSGVRLFGLGFVFPLLMILELVNLRIKFSCQVFESPDANLFAKALSIDKREIPRQ